MKKACAIVVMMTAALWATPSDAQAPRFISVSGSAVGYIPPDTVMWDVILHSSGTDMLNAKASSDQQVKNLIEACGKKGILASDIAIGSIKIQDAVNSTASYTVNRQVTIRQKDFASFTSTLDMLSRGNATIRYNFISSRNDQIARDTATKALQVTKDKAASMAAVFGATLGNVMVINEYPPPGWNVSEDDMPIEQNAAVFGADAKKIRVTMFVTFELQ